jgi:hypothetical protein
MNENTLESEANLRNEVGKEMDRVSSIVSKQLGDVIANSRWYSTLVVGEIAGIAKFANSTHWWTTTFFVFSLLALFASIVALVYSTVRAQELKYSIETTLAKLASALPSISFDGAAPDKIQEIKEAVQHLFSAGEKDADPQDLSGFGLWAFLVGSVFGGLALVFPS